MRRPRVYVTQKPPTRQDGPSVHRYLDLSPAERLGELVYLANRGDVEGGTEQELLWKFRERLADFDSRIDYLLPLGHLISIVAASIVAVEKGDGTLRILQWDKRVREYELFVLDVHAQPLREREK